MNRRQFVGVVGASFLAGCSGTSDGSGGGETEPTLIEGEPEELALELSDFEEAGWSKVDEESEGNRARRRFVNRDGGVVQIYSTVWVFDSITAAEDEYAAMQDEISSNTSTEESNVGAEGFAYVQGTAAVLFRDANVIGRSEHYGVSSGDIPTATEYANLMHDKWRS